MYDPIEYSQQADKIGTILVLIYRGETQKGSDLAEVTELVSSAVKDQNAGCLSMPKILIPILHSFRS